jgi:magnesium transporter
MLLMSSVETAGHHLSPRIPMASAEELVAAVTGRLRGQMLDGIDAVFVVSDEGRLVGAVRLVELMEASPEQAIGEIADDAYPRVLENDDQEVAPAEALAHRVVSVAVVDVDGRLLGAVPPLALLEILRREHVEDLHRLAGIQRETDWTRTELEAPPARRARHRLPWLVVGLAGSMLAALVISRFEHVLEQQLAVAYFVPAIVYLADAIGTQTEAIVVRGLSISRLPIGRLLGGEVRTGLLIGTILGALALPLVAVLVGDARLGVAVGISIMVAGGLATGIGLLLPWFLQRNGSDPALGSGPVATIVQDVLSILIYFAIVSAIGGSR